MPYPNPARQGGRGASSSYSIWVTRREENNAKTTCTDCRPAVADGLYPIGYDGGLLTIDLEKTPWLCATVGGLCRQRLSRSSAGRSTTCEDLLPGCGANPIVWA